MKKAYERPELYEERFDVEDMIVVSSVGGQSQPLDTINTAFQSPVLPVN
ncbi:MAG: hypothetical protein IJT44_02425 [Clostridia bacterium]|nr:hypothetical protein [Clostridia bacterium]